MTKCWYNLCKDLAVEAELLGRSLLTIRIKDHGAYEFGSVNLIFHSMRALSMISQTASLAKWCQKWKMEVTFFPFMAVKAKSFTDDLCQHNFSSSYNYQNSSLFFKYHGIQMSSPKIVVERRTKQTINMV